MDAIKSQLAQFRTKLDEIPVLQKAEEAAKVPKEYLVLAGGLFTLAILFFGVGAGTLCNVVGFVYPAYKSIEAIENQVRDDRQWLVYWVVYAFFSVIEVFADILLYWVPFYYAFKLAFLLWAMLPQTKGAQYLYDSFLKEFLKRNESQIDAALKDAKRSATTMVNEVAGAVNGETKKET